MANDDKCEIKAILIHEILTRIELLELSEQYSADEKIEIFKHALQIIDAANKEIKIEYDAQFD